jgi:transcriptional regulator with XRE-family HTH domain
MACVSEPRSQGPSLGDHLYALRTARKLSLRQAGTATGISFSRIGEFERGRDSHSGLPARPTYEQLVRLAKAYKTSADALLRRAGYHAGLDLPADEQRLLSAYRALPETMQPAAVLAMEAQATYYASAVTGTLAAESEPGIKPLGFRPPPA